MYNHDEIRIDEILNIAIGLDLFNNLRRLGYHTLEFCTYIQEEALIKKDEVEDRGLDCMIDTMIDDNGLLYNVWSKIRD